MPFYVGIDMGTSSLKLVLVDEKGSVVREASRAYAFDAPRPGWKEIDPGVWYEAMVDGLGELLIDVDKSAVAALGVTGQMHTTVFLDADGNSIRPAIMWNDTRTVEEVDYLKGALEGLSDEYLSRVISTGSPAAALLWLQRWEPERFSRLSTFLIGPDYLAFRLTGCYGTDWCEASTSSLFDVVGRRWSSDMRHLIGLPSSVYPHVRGAGEVIGQIDASIAEEVGLRRDVSVIAGTGDNPAAAFAVGCLAAGEPVVSLGTSGVLMFAREEPDFAAKGKNILVSIDGRNVVTLVQGALQSCGSSYSWWNERILGRASYDGIDREIGFNILGKNEVLFYPHLLGDKTIYGDPSLRGAFIGLSTDATPAALTLAVMEGVAYGVRQLRDEMCLACNGAMRVIGGGSRSDVWMQVLADVLGAPMTRIKGETSAGYGVALLARAAMCDCSGGESPVPSETQGHGETFLPDAVRVELYNHGYERYMRVHDALKAIDGWNDADGQVR